MRKINKIWCLTIGVIIGVVFTLICGAIKTSIDNRIPVLYQIQVDTEYINVRKEHDSTSKKLTEVYDGDIYDVVNVYDNELNKYIWYEIKLDKNTTGWVASSRVTNWVIVLGNEEE